jgi:peptidoglycan/LPS O-acetylase OafA/YrhL
VVAAHYEHPSYLPFIPGNLAVQFFFLLSGFYMALILESNPKYKSKKVFYSARFARIYSTYFVYLILGFAIAIPRVVELDWKSLSVTSFSIVVFSNLFIFGSDAIMFLENSTNAVGVDFTSNFRESAPELHTFLVMPQSWSLPLELYFYLLIPFILNRKKVLITLLALSIGFRLISIFLYGSNDPWNYRFFPSELIFFISGKFTYDSYHYLRRRKFLQKLESLDSKFRLALVPFVCYLLFLIYQREYGLLPSSISNSTFATSIRPVTLFVLAVCLTPIIFSLSRDLKFDRALGELSYPIYLGHLSVIALFETFNAVPSYFQILMLSTVIAIALSPVAKIFERWLNAMFVRMLTATRFDFSS